MKIQVSFGTGTGSPYTFEISDEVKVGDTVLTPPPYWDPRGPARAATVTEIGSAYTGPLSRAWLPPTMDGPESGSYRPNMDPS